MKESESFKFESTNRVKNLLTELYNHANKDRSKEWFNSNELEDIAKKHYDKPVIIRKAYAIEEMLTKMTDKNISERTLTYKINDGELIVGVLPMGSNGLGKVFPNYLTENEQRAGSFTNRSELSILGHNTVNYDVLLKKGLNGIITDAKNKKNKLKEDIDKLNKEESDLIASIKCDNTDAKKEIKKVQLKYKIQRNKLQYSIDFYEAVIISCNSVKNYSLKFADLAADMAAKLTSPEDMERKDELLKIEKICRKVPMKAPENFHEALQSIYTFHVALHASLDFVSLGRLDQVLIKYIGSEDVSNIKKCTELFECFIIKAASRLNLTTEYLLEQDHVDFSAALGIHPYYLDQRAGVNNFLQNIIVGGKTPDGVDATNRMTYVILNAFENVNLSTPGIYVRLHNESPEALVSTVSKMLSKTENLPGILNDDVLIPALYNSMLENEVLRALPDKEDELSGKEKEYLKICNDYCVDGCWEPILNGISDWTFGMLNGMDILQCALNRGATLDKNIGTLRGAKKSIMSDKVESYEDFQRIFKEHMRFFIDQSTFGLYDYYMLDEFVNPSPLFSAVLGTCMERGRDKSWGGTEYNIGGTILIGVPDMINTIAAINKWVFKKEKYKLQDVLDAMRDGFEAPEGDIQLQSKYSDIKIDFDTNSPKFGNNNKQTAEIGDFIVETFCDAVKSSKKLADKIFLKPLDELYDQTSYIKRCNNFNSCNCSDNQDNYEDYDITQTEILKLRKICGYYGTSLQERFGKDFNIRFTAGCGTFEQYPLQGSGVAASPNRSWGAPLAPNLSPYPGTTDKTAAHILSSLKSLKLNRLAAGAITDLCIDSENLDSDTKIDQINGIIKKFISSDGNMMTLALGNKETYQKIYSLSYDAIKNNDKKSYEELQKYKHINVRVGGWQAPFITMSLEQQKSYADRVISKK
jgi:formate C-acetyltransferase